MVIRLLPLLIHYSRLKNQLNRYSPPPPTRLPSKRSKGVVWCNRFLSPEARPGLLPLTSSGRMCPAPSNDLRHGRHPFVWCRLPSPASQKRPILQTNEQREKRPLVGGHGWRRAPLATLKVSSECWKAMRPAESV